MRIEFSFILILKIKIEFLRSANVLYHFEPNPFNLCKHASSVYNMISVKANIESIRNSTLTIDPTHSSSPLSAH